jgi:hypothetical protein
MPAVDLSTTHFTAFVILSEPNEHGKRFIKPFLLSEDQLIFVLKEDQVPYRYWKMPDISCYTWKCG